MSNVFQESVWRKQNKMVFEWFQQQDDDSSIVMQHISLIKKNEIVSKMDEAIKVRILFFVFLFCSIMDIVSMAFVFVGPP